MATVVLSAAGAAIGGSIGGTLAGLSSVVIGRAVGATLGRVVDQQLMGAGSDVVETGRVDRFRITSAGEGAPVAQLYGRMRLGGQVIWASDFQEVVSVSGGGKGGPRQPETRSYSYSVSLAIALCEGEITRVGRVWADGEEVAPDELNMRVYTGSHDQLPDPVMEAIEGPGLVPAYRGTAYVVLEDLGLERFGNRVPQFSFEVARPEQPDAPQAQIDPTFALKGVALIPGTGEYGLATTEAYYTDGPASRWSANVNSPAQKTDFAASLEDLGGSLPNLEATSLVVSWFGSDLRCGHCQLRPKVEDKSVEGENMPWSVAGLSRASAKAMARDGDRPLYGGTPTDASVIEAVQALHAAGKSVMFYPFILMDQIEGNTLPDPYSGAETQPALPWRGRITLSQAPGRPASPDGTPEAEAQVDAFFGSVTAADFDVGAGTVGYSGPQEWSLSRFILHYAALCAAAGGVEAFCISSEMRGVTQIRGVGNSFVAVARLRALAAEVRLILGADTKISYAADWSEYFGYQPQDGTGDVYFHLDPLWADPDIDFIGIDNYMPLSDWREGRDHLDARNGAAAIYDLDYLRSNVAGGEGYDYYYHSDQAREAQIRSPITDGTFDEPWVFRVKDIRNWWSNVHHERTGGVRSATPTAWIAGSKPIWFTEMGCGAVDKATNQPNKFLDFKSSESSLPHFSDGGRDDLIQMQYLRAMVSYWTDPANNPVSEEYSGPMVDMSRAFVWAWDVRPYPFFPNNRGLWSDGQNYLRGHWINGRTSARSLASVVGEICRRAGLEAYDTSALFGTVRGYVVGDVGDARSALQPLMLRYAFDAIERDGTLVFRMRDGLDPTPLVRAQMAINPEMEGDVEENRTAEAEMAGRVRLRFVEADADFDTLAEEAILPDDATHAVATSEIPMALTRAEARQVAERWLTEARVAREGVRLALPPSRLSLGAGDVIALPPDQTEGTALYRIDRVEQGAMQVIEGVRIEPEVYRAADLSDALGNIRAFSAPVPVVPFFMDLPLIKGDEQPHAPHIAVTAQPWPGSAAVYRSATGSDYRLQNILPTRSVIGTTQNALRAAPSGLIDRGEQLEVKLINGSLSGVEMGALLSGANLAAIGDGSSDRWELFQFQDVQMVAKDTYWLTTRLRGQLGSDGLMPEVWPEGSWFILMNGIPAQIDISPNLRRVAQHYRIGPARRAVSDPSYVEQVRAFDGNGLRPYAPVHLNVTSGADGAYQASWIRRTRIGGDGWEAPEVPLGEEAERYTVRVVKDGALIRTQDVTSPLWSYGAVQQAADSLSAPFTIEVAQVSASYGAGLWARREVPA